MTLNKIVIETRSRLEQNINYIFKSKELLTKALTHPSVKASQLRAKDEETYERLEFLGDSLINFAISQELYKNFPSYSEGKLSKLRMSLVCGETMAKIATKLDLGKALIMDNGEETLGGRVNPKNLENALEAICAAIFLDSNDYMLAKDIIVGLWKDFIEQDNYADYDPKTTLQELLYKKFQKTPEYHLISTQGSAHNLTFEISVTAEGFELFYGSAKSRKAAEKIAAINMLRKLSLSS